ncbi:MAG: stage II sporulation protein P [Tissierellia bacterium]|nr:stage II sporulation protein P [Tissierellia bacterium]
MKRRRRNKGGTKYYMVMSIICLSVLFIGYSYVYKLSEARKTGQDVTTISIGYDGEETAKKYGKIFDKLMSYFNIFFEETFKETDDSSIIIENYDKEAAKDVYKVVENKEEDNSLDVYDEEDEDEQIVERTVFVANNRKEDFFKVVETDTVSRGSAPRDMTIDAASINENINFVLYHTHGTEAYSSYKDTNYRTTNEKDNVTGVGNRIAANIESYGINIKHLKDYNDYPSYNLSYTNSNAAVKQHLSNTKKNLLIDLHRDGADENSSYEKFLSRVSTTEINNKTAATFTMVIGNKNGNYSELRKIAQTVYDVSNELYPGLCREIIVREGAYFNQYLSDYSLLVEIGSTMNTLEEVNYTADLISEILCKTIVKINN